MAVAELQQPVPDPDDEVPPSTPVTKPVPGAKLSAIDLVKVACSGRKRSRSEKGKLTRKIAV